MRSYYRRIKSNADLTVQRINYVRMNSSLLLRNLTVKFFLTICISCVLFQIVTSEIVEKEINLQVEREKREAEDVQMNAKLLESKNDNKAVQIRQEKNTEASKHEKRNDETVYLEEERLRIRRERGKNKKRSQKGTKRQKKHRRNRRRKTNDILVAKFNGAIPEMHVENDGLIGPWMKSISEMNNPFEFTNFHLVEEQKAIEITKSGLYTISVQIAYTGNSAPNSYKIMLSSESDIAVKIAMCSTNSTDSTCPTSTTKYMKEKDRIRIQQQEKNRSINLRPGFSFIDLIFYGQSEKNNSEV